LGSCFFRIVAERRRDDCAGDGDEREHEHELGLDETSLG
jgi:hypothetical protein